MTIKKGNLTNIDQKNNKYGRGSKSLPKRLF